MSVENLKLWQNATEHFDKGNYMESIKDFMLIVPQSSRIYYNIGVSYFKLSLLDKCIRYLDYALLCDKYFVLADFCRGLINYYQGCFNEAANEFAICISNMNNREFLNYNQLGLKYILYQHIIYLNLAKCKSLLGLEIEAIALMDRASCLPTLKDKVKSSESSNLSVSYEPLNLIFKPPNYKINNLEKHNYLKPSTIIPVHSPLNSSTTIGSSQHLLCVESPFNRSRSLGELDLLSGQSDNQISKSKLTSEDDLKREIVHTVDEKIKPPIPPRTYVMKKPILTFGKDNTNFDLNYDKTHNLKMSRAKSMDELCENIKKNTDSNNNHIPTKNLVMKISKEIADGNVIMQKTENRKMKTPALSSIPTKAVWYDKSQLVVTYDNHQHANKEKVNIKPPVPPRTYYDSEHYTSRKYDATVGVENK